MSKKVLRREFIVYSKKDKKIIDGIISQIRDIAKDNDYNYGAVLDQLDFASNEYSSNSKVEDFIQDLRQSVEPMLDSLNNQFSLKSCGISAWTNKVGGDFLVSFKPQFVRKEEESLDYFIEQLEKGLKPYQKKSFKDKTKICG